MNKSLNDYEKKFLEYTNKIRSNGFYIQLLISKCCDYSFLTHINKNASYDIIVSLWKMSFCVEAFIFGIKTIPTVLNALHSKC